jgi:hypothetical protein
MTQYVQLSTDSASVVTWYAGPQAITSDKPGYVEIADDDARYLAWRAAQQATVSGQALIAAGISIVSTGTPALNGTYAINPAAKTDIDGIYSSIKNGDGLPGGGASFNYFDIAGAPHSFEAVSFPNFAKAVRDYIYAISQGQTPAMPITIP